VITSIEDITDSEFYTDELSSSIVICAQELSMTIHTPDNVYSETHRVVRSGVPSLTFNKHTWRKGTKEYNIASNEHNWNPFELSIFVEDSSVLFDVGPCSLRDIMINGEVTSNVESFEFNDAEIELLDVTYAPYIRLSLRPKSVKHRLLTDILESN
jgi:hypothetical protein